MEAVAADALEEAAAAVHEPLGEGLRVGSPRGLQVRRRRMEALRLQAEPLHLLRVPGLDAVLPT
jgi:hypothetical protein